MPEPFKNPYRPGAGHMPPYLAGREQETAELRRLLTQETILENMVLTGLRGVGKTVLLETFKPLAMQAGWWWVGNDLSESSSISEEHLATRLLTDLAVSTSSVVVDSQMSLPGIGFGREEKLIENRLSFNTLISKFQNTPGLSSDKLKAVLELVWCGLKKEQIRGVVFAYDEAQNLADHAAKEQHPLSLLLDVFQSIQRKGIPFFLLLTGLPTLFPKLVEARTYAERMFRVIDLEKLNREDSREAILKPLEMDNCPIRLDDESLEMVIRESDGYPYFIQFICREVFDSFLLSAGLGVSHRVPVEDIIRKLDSDFFAGRWNRATDRQQDLLWVIATLGSDSGEFTVQNVSELSQVLLDKPFSPSHINQMLVTLSDKGLIYKNRRGRYMLAVPLMAQFILRQRSPNPH